MSNYYAASRSNYFAVKDETAFRQWVDSLNASIRLIENNDDGVKRFAMSMDDSDSGSWPSQKLGKTEDGGDDFDDLDILSELSEHLVEGEVAVLLEAGHVAYYGGRTGSVNGWAGAVNSAGETVSVSTYDIYDKARAAFGGAAHINQVE